VEPKELDLRCSCSRKPLLGVAGRDLNSGEPYVHIKSWKAGRLIVEVVVTSGVVRIHCRECLRWHTVKIVQGGVTSKSERLPESIPV